MRRILLVISMLLFTTSGYATCEAKGSLIGSPIIMDISELSPEHPVLSRTVITNFPGTFKCTTRKGKFGYTKMLVDGMNETIIGFNLGKDNVKVVIDSTLPNIELAVSGEESASRLNVPLRFVFYLVDKKGKEIPGDSMSFNDVILVTDLSDMSLWEVIAWPAKQLGKIITWLFNGFNWPKDERDMFSQGLKLQYRPKATTCYFKDDGRTIPIKEINRDQLFNNEQPGFTQFVLRVECKNLGLNQTSGSFIDMFLSSNNLLETDDTVLIDKTVGNAKGVGLKVVKLTNSITPIKISRVIGVKGNATSLHTINRGESIDPNIYIPMGVYYYPWRKNNIVGGKLITTATLNIIYK